MCSVKYEDCEEIFFLPPTVGVVVPVCLSSLLITDDVIKCSKMQSGTTRVASCFAVTAFVHFMTSSVVSKRPQTTENCM